MKPDESWVLLMAKKPPFNTQLGPRATFQNPVWAENWYALMWFKNYGVVQEQRLEIAKRTKEYRDIARKNPKEHLKRSSLKL